MDKSKRKFLLTGFGVLGLAGVAKAAVRNVETEEINQHIPNNRETLLIMGGIEETKPTQYSSEYGDFFISTDSFSPRYQNQVELTVGKDNRLWIKTSGQWKRVAVD